MRMLGWLLGRGLPGGSRAGDGTRRTPATAQPARDRALAAYVASLPPLAQAKVAAAPEVVAMIGGDLAREVAGVARPALRRHRPGRPPHLWRMICLPAEHVFVDEATPKGAWAVPRQLAEPIERYVASRFPHWADAERAFAVARTPERRLEASTAAMLLIGRFLLDAIPKDGEMRLLRGIGTLAQKRTWVRLFAECLLVGPVFLDIGRRLLGLGAETLADLPFACRDQRVRLHWERAKALTFREIIAGIDRLDARAEAVVTTQLALVLHPVPTLAAALPAAAIANPALLRGTTAGEIVGFLIERLDRLAADLERDARAWQRLPLGAPSFPQVGTALRERIERFLDEWRACVEALRPRQKTAVGERMRTVRARACDSVCGIVLPRAVEHIEDSSLRPQRGGDLPAAPLARRAAEIVLGGLVGTGIRFTARMGNTVQSLAVRQRFMEAVDVTEAHFTPSHFDVGAPGLRDAENALCHLYCVLTAMGEEDRIDRSVRRLHVPWRGVPPWQGCPLEPGTACERRCRGGRPRPSGPANGSEAAAP